ncbi:MAG: aminotransferase class V-fold PLP-dependent enzyme, partial [Actinobacteria bacterium]|nr:aminotransferase class V-fold PLP-dependent enzyme [Actinomycetota bacterium]NDE20757.1 aminotransferase class V-fold PLP-dependent enzyme [Actinomycetota bacterium]
MRTAAELDAADPLRAYRDEFVITDPDVCYLDGNSLGRLPKRTVDIVHRYLTEEWGSELVTGWSHWIDEAQRVGDLIGRVALGAKAGQTLAVDTTSTNFYQLCDAALRSCPNRGTVLSDTANFPTDRYILEGLCDRYGKRLVLINDESGEEYVTPAMLAQHLGSDTALVTLSVVQYRSGALHDVRQLTRMAHDAGALVVWDASHAVGVVDMQFDADDVDLAVGCTYKYGNSGPGSPAWLYVNERLQSTLRVPIQGWFAQRDQFAMGQGFDRADGMRGFQIASPSVVGMRCIEAAFGMIGEAGLPAIAAKAALGTALMVRLHDEWLAPLGFELVTPRDPLRRGGHVTLRHPDAKQIAVAMRELTKVIPDYREPSSIRLAMSPLATSFAEVWEGFDRIRRLVESKRYRDVASAASRVT